MLAQPLSTSSDFRFSALAYWCTAPWPPNHSKPNWCCFFSFRGRQNHKTGWMNDKIWQNQLPPNMKYIINYMLKIIPLSNFPCQIAIPLSNIFQSKPLKSIGSPRFWELESWDFELRWEQDKTSGLDVQPETSKSKTDGYWVSPEKCETKAAISGDPCAKPKRKSEVVKLYQT